MIIMGEQLQIEKKIEQWIDEHFTGVVETKVDLKSKVMTHADGTLEVCDVKIIRRNQYETLHQSFTCRLCCEVLSFYVHIVNHIIESHPDIWETLTKK